MTKLAKTGILAAVALAVSACGGGGTDQSVAPPAAPTGLAAEIQDAATVRLTWTDVATTETGYRVERSGDGGATFAALGLELAPDSSSYVDTPVAAGTTWQYRVAALGRGGTVRSPAVAVPLLVAAAPTGGSAVATASTSIHVTWTNVATDALSITVYRSPDDTTYGEIASLDAAATSYDDGGLAASTTYYYRVTATNLVGESAAWASGSATTQAPPLVPPNAAPTALAAGSPGATSVPLTWTCAATNEDGFRVYWATTSVKPGTPNATVAANATSATATGLSSSTAYWFWVSAYNAAGESAAAGPATATTLQPLPAAPTNFVPAAYKPPKSFVYTGIRFTWTDASTNEDGFRVYGMPYDALLGCAYKGVWTLLGTAAANATTLTWTFPASPPAAGTRSCFRMASYNGTGSSYTAAVAYTMPP